MITGETGCGRTTLIEKFLSELDEIVTVARLPQTRITPVVLLQTLLVQFGYRPFDTGKAELLGTIKPHLAELLQHGRKVVIVVDEAQNLAWAVLEETRMLSGAVVGRETVLSIVLAGRPKLNETLDSPDLEQVARRTRLCYHVWPPAEKESGAYIQHRLRVAGAGERRGFDEATYPAIYRCTGDVPRLINTLCDTDLLCAFADGLDAIGEKELATAVEELRWTGYNSRTDRLSILRGHPSLQPGPIRSAA